LISDLSQITVAILAGGLGTRLRTAISDRPKVLAPVKGRPFITYLLDYLYALSVRHVVLLTGYLGEMVKDALGLRWKDMEISYSKEELPLDTGGAIRKALPFLGNSPVLVLNGDSFCPIDIDPFLSMHTKVNSSATILLTYVQDISRYGRVRLHSDGSIVDFLEKSPNPISGWINAGVYFLNKNIINEINPNKKVSLERDVFPRLVGKGLHGYKCPAPFIDIGLPETYHQAEGFIADLKSGEYKYEYFGI